jgi:hypothetical protein
MDKGGTKAERTTKPYPVDIPLTPRDNQWIFKRRESQFVWWDSTIEWLDIGDCIEFIEMPRRQLVARGQGRIEEHMVAGVGGRVVLCHLPPDVLPGLLRASRNHFSAALCEG